MTTRSDRLLPQGRCVGTELSAALQCDRFLVDRCTDIDSSNIAAVQTFDKVSITSRRLSESRLIYCGQA